MLEPGRRLHPVRHGKASGCGIYGLNRSRKVHATGDRAIHRKDRGRLSRRRERELPQLSRPAKLGTHVRKCILDPHRVTRQRYLPHARTRPAYQANSEAPGLENHRIPNEE